MKLNSINSIEDAVRQNSAVAVLIHNYKTAHKYLQSAKRTNDIAIITKARNEFANADWDIRGAINQPEISEANMNRIKKAIHTAIKPEMNFNFRTV